MKFIALALCAASISSLLVAASPQGDLATPSELPADIPAGETATSTVSEADSTSSTPQGDIAAPSALPTDAAPPPADVPADETAASTVTEAYVTATDAPAATSTVADAAITAQAREDQPTTFGPVGKLNSPSEWTVIKSSPYGNGGIWIDYTPVASRDARTYGISVQLGDLNGNTSWDYPVHLAVNPKSRKVNAYINVPEGTCGARTVIVYEVQRWKGATRDFLITRRPIYINCDSGDQYANY